MLDDWDEYLDHIEYKYKITQKTYDKHKIINIILNILAIVGITVFAYIKKVGFLNYTYLMLAGFVAFDVFALLVDKAVLSNIGLINKIKDKIRLLKFKHMPREEQLEFIEKKEKEREQYNEYSYRRRSHYREELEDIDNEIEEYKKNLKEVEEDNNLIDDAIQKRYLNDISYAENILAEISVQKPKYSKDIQKKIDEVVDISKKLIDICKNEPILIGQLMKTFNIYLVELIDILDTHQKLSKEEQKNSIVKINMIFEELINHLNDLKEKIETDSSERFNTSADLLLQTLKEQKKKGVQKNV